MIASNIKISSIQRLKVLKSTAVTSRLAADQQKMDDDFCRSLDIEMEKEALGTENKGQKDTDSTSRDGLSATTSLSQYNASTTIQPTNTPGKKPVPITDFARTYQPATDMTYVNEMTLFTEDPSNFNEDIHIVDELISRVVLGSLVKLNRDTKEACKLGANKLHQAELDVWNTKNVLETYRKPGMFMGSIQLKANLNVIEPLRHDTVCIGLVEEMTKERMEYQQRAQNLLNRYSVQKYTYYKCKLLDTFQDVMFDILQLRARWTTPVMDKQILAKMMDYDEDDFANEEPKDTETDAKTNMNDASGFAYLLILTGNAATALKSWGKFKTTAIMLERLTKRLRYPIKQQIDVSKTFPFECIRFGKNAYKKPNHNTWKLAKSMATELERYTVAITLRMKTSFYMQVVRSKCKKGAAIYQNRGEAVARTADVSDIVKRSPEGSNKELIEFNKWRRNLYINCGNKLQETSKNILRTSSTLQQLEKDKELTRKNNNNMNNKNNHMNNRNNNNSNRKHDKTRTTTTATVTGATPSKKLRNPYEKKQKKSNNEKHNNNNNNNSNNNNNNNSNNSNNSNSNNNKSNVDDETLTQSTTDTSKRSIASQESKRKRNMKRRTMKSEKRQKKHPKK